jgi:GNAT superfamily N-acetyltransferase
MNEIVVRTTQDSDRKVLTGLMYEYIVDFYKRPKPPLNKLKGLIQMLLEGKEGVQFVAEKDGRIVGFATLYFTYSSTRVSKIVIMNDLYVVEEMRGTSVAEKLFQACLAYKNENHYAAMVWETAQDNKRAQRFYEKMGGELGDWFTYSN